MPTPTRRRLLFTLDRVATQAAQVSEASATVQNETAKILSLVKNLADELPDRFDSQTIARSIGERIQAEEIGPLLTVHTAITTATANLNKATERAQKAHAAIESSASIGSTCSISGAASSGWGKWGE